MTKPKLPLRFWRGRVTGSVHIQDPNKRQDKGFALCGIWLDLRTSVEEVTDRVVELKAQLGWCPLCEREATRRKVDLPCS